MKANITLGLDADLLRQAHILAAEKGTSIASLLEEQLKSIIRERNAFDQAKRRALARLSEGYDLHWSPGPRHELHEQ
jgi:hypothetical protein